MKPDTTKTGISNVSEYKKRFEQLMRCIQNNNRQESIVLGQQLISDYPAELQPYIVLGSSYLANAQAELAIATLQSALVLAPDNTQIHNNLGTAYKINNQPAQAIDSFQSAVEHDRQNLQALFNLGVCLKSESPQQAATYFIELLDLKPDHKQALIYLGQTYIALDKFRLAVETFDQLITLDPTIINAYIFQSQAYYQLGNPARSLKVMTTALQIFKQGKYRSMLDKQENLAEFYSNRGLTLLKLKRYSPALSNFNKSIQLNPAFAPAYLNMGSLFQETLELEKATKSYNKAIQLDPGNEKAWLISGHHYRDQQQYKRAIANYEKACTINPRHSVGLGNLLRAKMHICDWTDTDKLLHKLEESGSSNPQSTPVPLHSLIDKPLAHQLAARHWGNHQCPENPCLESNQKSRADKIRIAYFSADFGLHPVSVLTAKLFEEHDTDAFEVFAFSLGENRDDPYQTRIRNCFKENFLEVRHKSDIEIAELARHLNIDIALDLGGYTKNCRTGIFACRAAPIQICYLGYLGTMGMPYFDYLIADKVIIPPGNERFFDEKIIFLPDFQVNDSSRNPVQKKYSKADLGIPADTFAYCCLNNIYKITPKVFGRWMNILRNVDNSVLVLNADNHTATKNLRQEAQNYGIEPHRLIFVSKLGYTDYLSRYQAMDLFLDTSPYNAGTTASDALWAGLPILTMTGESFPARMASSILNSIDMPELITQTPEQYQNQAIKLGSDPELMRAVKEKLQKNRLTTPLFNTTLFTRNLELALTMIYKLNQDDLLPRHIDINQYHDIMPLTD